MKEKDMTARWIAVAFLMMASGALALEAADRPNLLFPEETPTPRFQSSSG